MRKLLSIGLFLLSFSLFSQEKEPQKLTFSAYIGLYLGLIAGFDYGVEGKSDW